MSMLMIEARQSLRIRYQGQIVALVPGERLPLPDDKARKVLQQVGDKVRIIPTIAPGTVITWCSMDGNLRGPVPVQESFFDQESSRTWIVVTWARTVHLLREDLVIGQEPGPGQKGQDVGGDRDESGS